MVLPFLPGDNATQPMRRPVFEVAFGDSEPWKRSLVALVVESGLAPGVDVLEIFVAADDQSPQVALDDSGSISLGYEDEGATPVFSGRIEAVQHQSDGATRVTATNGGAPLSRLRVNQSYEQRSAGDIVRDLAGRTGVDTDIVENGVDFPFYVVDDRSSAYRHVAALATRSNFLARFTPEGKLNFAPSASSQPVQTFSHGGDILSLKITDAAPVVGAITMVGEGAAGSQGQEAWSWLVKDPSSVTGKSGEGVPERMVGDSSLRSGDAAQGAAEGISGAAYLERVGGGLLVPGAPAVVAGSMVEVVDAPRAAMNGLYLVRRVVHRFSKRGGFTTRMQVRKSGEGKPLGNLLGGLL